jgi:hypothetical protein
MKLFMLSSKLFSAGAAVPVAFQLGAAAAAGTVPADAVGTAPAVIAPMPTAPATLPSVLLLTRAPGTDGDLAVRRSIRAAVARSRPSCR